MIIKQLDASDLGSVLRWNEFVFACPEATFFHRAEWQKIIGEVFRHPTFSLRRKGKSDRRCSATGARKTAAFSATPLSHCPLPFMPASHRMTLKLKLALKQKRNNWQSNLTLITLNSEMCQQNTQIGRHKTYTSPFEKKSCLMPKPTCLPFHASSEQWFEKESKIA
jgi:hypothetical protein